MNSHSIGNEKILSKTESRITLEFMIPATSDFFDGHFPHFKLLPAVGQFEIITRFSNKYFGSSRNTPKIRRIKFSSPILPDTTVNLELSYVEEKKTVSFVMRDAANEKRTYSSGIFSVE